MAYKSINLVSYRSPLQIASVKRPEQGNRNHIESATDQGGINSSFTKTLAHSRIEEPASGKLVEDVLAAAIPPKKWTENGRNYVQYASSVPAKLSDIIKLEEQLLAALEEQNAREIGICPIREHIFSQLLEELIRQEVLFCQERGLLLIRIRNEYAYQIDAYQRLYESSILHTTRKAWRVKSNKKRLQERNTLLAGEKKKLENEIGKLGDSINNRKSLTCSLVLEENEKHAEKCKELAANLKKFKSTLEELFCTIEIEN
ncbi:putative axonemal dynein light chain p33 [Cardiosporidium cionae]|uniref:Axonemal dynein light chain p33 n=1 Tax=Cardiosporidium cionae TaxID=476202 RepID=A0ABQ7JAZ4_9APIC|nr:putative axonemal dynein light chain p33 [Cardiosporidium cionae]|eukprot:KAF8821172.1 putative axonemal dynein light chain p33 [Cardiosporidium cionae]